jgi:REP element-mobilizing transposase RayT
MEGGVYHVTCRGNEQKRIFADDKDRERFLARLQESQEQLQVNVYLYCLMSNHLHLLVETPQANLNRFMSSVLTGYTVYFNVRHKRHGHLMQGRYGAQLVETDEHLLKLSRYIHLNPVQVKAWRNRPIRERIRALRSYAWSSFPMYAGIAKPFDWLVMDPVKAQMKRIGRSARPKAYAAYVESGLARSDEEFICLLHDNPVAIGTTSFVDQVKQSSRDLVGSRVKRDDVPLGSITVWMRPEDILARVQKLLGNQQYLLDHRKHGAIARGLYAWALQRYAGMNQREVATRLGISTGAGVSAMVKRARITPQFLRWQQRLELLIEG